MTRKGIVGAHVSAAGGHFRAIENGMRLGVDAIQMFGASPQMWAAKHPTPEQAEKFKKAREGSGISQVFLHAAYLVNAASPDPIIRARSVQSLVDHLSIAEMLGADGLIFHLGSGKELPVEEASSHLEHAMKDVLEKVPGSAKLVMENSAGGGKKIGSTLGQLGELLRAVSNPRVAVCLDTAHAFEAGIIEKFTPEEVKSFFDEFESAIGMKHLVAIHANDSMTQFNSHHDRHENIGEGYIGLKGFHALAAEARLSGVPFILETPGFTGEGPDEENVRRLRAAFAK